MPSLFDLFDPSYIPCAVRMITAGESISREDLADLIVASAGQPRPAIIDLHIAEHLSGKVRAKPGPKRRDEEFIISLADSVYREALALLQAEEVDWNEAPLSPALQNFDGTPHERAAEVVRALFFRHISIRSVQNKLAAYRNPNSSKPLIGVVRRDGINSVEGQSEPSP